jgi:hypothetical protein
MLEVDWSRFLRVTLSITKLGKTRAVEMYAVERNCTLLGWPR